MNPIEPFTKPDEQCGNLVSVIVPTCGRPAYLRETLLSLLQQNVPQNYYEIIVIDNKPTGEVKEIVSTLNGEHDGNIQYFKEREPGLLSGRHKGAKEAKGEILIFVDDDIVADKGWLRAIVETFQDPGVHLVGGRNLALFEVEPPNWLGAYWHKNEYGRRCGYLSLLDFGDETHEIDPVYVWGLNYAIRKQTLYNLGGFHPDIVLPWEIYRRYIGDGETGLSLKAKVLKLKAVYQPRALVQHRVPAKRLTIDYFKRRAFYQGICDSYTAIRKNGGLTSDAMEGRRSSWKIHLRIVKQAVKRWVLALPPRINDPYYKIKTRIRLAYERGYAYHQHEVQKDPALLHWVLKENYWDYRLPRS